MAKQDNNTQTVTATVKLLSKEYELYSCMAEDASHKKITYNIELRIIGTTVLNLAIAVIVVYVIDVVVVVNDDDCNDDDTGVTFCIVMSRVGRLGRVRFKLEKMEAVFSEYEVLLNKISE